MLFKSRTVSGFMKSIVNELWRSEGWTLNIYIERARDHESWKPRLAYMTREIDKQR